MGILHTLDFYDLNDCTSYSHPRYEIQVFNKEQFIFCHSLDQTLLANNDSLHSIKRTYLIRACQNNINVIRSLQYQLTSIQNCSQTVSLGCSPHSPLQTNYKLQVSSVRSCSMACSHQSQDHQTSSLQELKVLLKCRRPKCRA